jgi:hypothetical protein
VFTLQTVAAQGEGEARSGAAQAGGFSLHVGVSIKPGQRAKLERLCRYVSRSPLAQDRLTLSASGSGIGQAAGEACAARGARTAGSVGGLTWRSDATGRASAGRADTVHWRYRYRAARVALDDRGAGDDGRRRRHRALSGRVGQPIQGRWWPAAHRREAGRLQAAARGGWQGRLKVLFAGFVGNYLVRHLLRRGDSVIVWTRDADRALDLFGPHVRIVTELAGQPPLHAVVHLAGAPVFGVPWTASRRRTLIASRVESATALLDLCSKLPNPPRVWVGASAIGCYGAHEARRHP